MPWTVDLSLPVKVTLVRLPQPENASDPMLVTLLGMATLVSPLQFSNAYDPMFVTLFGIVTLVRPLQPLNVDDLILMTLSDMTILEILVYDDGNTDPNIELHMTCGIVTLVRPLQP